MKKRQSNSARASAVRITLSAALISIAAVLLASSFSAAPATNELGAAVAPSSEGHKDSTIGSWTATGSLHFARAGRTGTALLSNGKVLVSGGSLGICCGPLNSAELYDAASGTWTVTGSLNFVHYYHTATLLPNGKVLAAGGANSYPQNIAELYDPASGTWTLTGSLHAAREIHTATLLPNGKVLVVGGFNDNNGASILASAELYDPASGTWTLTGSLNTARAYHTATLLPNGKVLVAGGIGPDVFGHSIAELYDPATGAWTLTGSLNVGRYLHTATLLPNGKVLVAGGDGTTSSPFSSAELYDPASGTWTLTGSLVTARDYHTATLLPDGRVLVAGGYNFNAGGSLRNAELYDPRAGAGPVQAASTLRASTPRRPCCPTARC